MISYCGLKNILTAFIATLYNSNNLISPLIDLQEAEREQQAVGQGAYGGRRGRVHGLGLAATAWAQGGPSCQWGHAGLDGTPQARFPLWPSLAAQTSLL